MENNMKTKLRQVTPWYIISENIHDFREQEQLYVKKANLSPLDIEHNMHRHFGSFPSASTSQRFPVAVPTLWHPHTWLQAHLSVDFEQCALGGEQINGLDSSQGFHHVINQKMANTIFSLEQYIIAAMTTEAGNSRPKG